MIILKKLNNISMYHLGKGSKSLTVNKGTRRPIKMKMVINILMVM